jgi:predicted ArsR family transcriptional regulator
MPHERKDLEGQLESLAALEDPVRRKLYLLAVGSDGELSRDRAARAAGVSRALAAFHLDRLVEAGLLEASFRRLSSRGGPGAGRPSKLYRRASRQFEVSLPRRRFDVAAGVLAQALASTSGAIDLEPVRRAARDWGERLAKAAPPSRSTRPLTRATRALEECGFEPHRAASGDVVLRNCPFAPLSAERRDLICGMNVALIEGLLSGLELDGVEARLAPEPGRCCVVLSARGAERP